MSYVQEAYAKVEARSAGEPEFLQAVKEVFQSSSPSLKNVRIWLRPVSWSGWPSRSGRSCSGWFGRMMREISR